MSDKLLKDQILYLYQRNPNISRKLISTITGAAYGWVRNVISTYTRDQVTKKRGVSELPFNFHGWFWSGCWKSELYEKFPGEIVNVRNGMKRWKGRLFSFIMHKGGRVFLYPLTDLEASWRVECLEFLQSWLHPKYAEALLKSANLQKVGKKSYAVSTPGVPKHIQVTLKGIGTMKTDTTPFPDGTSEVEIDPGFEKRLENIERSMNRMTVVMEKLFSLFDEKKPGFKVPGSENQFVV